MDARKSLQDDPLIIPGRDATALMPQSFRDTAMKIWVVLDRSATERSVRLFNRFDGGQPVFQLCHLPRLQRGFEMNRVVPLVPELNLDRISGNSNELAYRGYVLGYPGL